MNDFDTRSTPSSENPSLQIPTTQQGSGGSSVIRDSKLSRDPSNEGGSLQRSGKPDGVHYSAGQKISNAVSAGGVPLAPHEVTDDALVRVGGVEATVGSLIRMGHAHRTADGSVVLGPAGGDTDKRRQQQDAQPDADVEQGTPFADAGLEEEFSAALSLVQPSTAIQAITTAIDLGSPSEASIGAIASQMGIEPHEAADKVSRIKDAYAQQAHSVIGQEVPFVSPETVTEWAHKNATAEMRKAMHDHAMHRRTGGYRTVARAFVESMDEHHSEELLNADFGPGVAIYRAGDRKLIVRTPHGEMQWKQAVRRGLIRVGRNG